MKLILAIDDDENILKVLELQLAKYGFKVITAKDGEKGIELAKTGNPDLILLDIMMPQMNGFSVIKSLKKDEITKIIPIIMLTSKSDKDDVLESMKMGASDYIRKPYNYKNLIAKINTVIKFKQLKKEKQIEKKSEYISIYREKNRTIVMFNTALNNSKVKEEMRSLFNRGFLNLTKKDNLIIDIRSLNTLSKDEVFILKNITDLFADRKVYVVAGRHYGIIAEECNFEDRIELFISPGDMELTLEQN